MADFIYSLDELKQLRLWHDCKPGITQGYRAGHSLTYTQMIRSVLRLHNESTNIWTHLLAAVYCSYVCFLALSNQLEKTPLFFYSFDPPN